MDDGQHLLNSARTIRTLRELQTGLAYLAQLPVQILRNITDFHARVAVLGNFSTQFVTGALRLALIHRSVFAEIYEAPFDQWETLLLDPHSEFLRFQPDMTLILLTRRSNAANLDDRVARAVRFAKANGLKRTAVIWIEAHSTELSLAAVERVISRPPWFAERFWLTAKLPFHPDHSGYVGRFLSGIVRNYISPLIKVVVTDLDQVLWGGIVGEIGASDIRLAEDSHLRLQRFLLSLRDRGVLLAVNSANNEADALEPFDTRSDMLIKRSDFSAFVANWEPKSQNIERISTQLNVGLQNICFFDDSPFEREQVRAVLPDVIVPELPSEPREIVPFLEASGDFLVSVTTEEDSRRVEFMELEVKRSAERDRATTLEDYYRGLDLVLSPVHVDVHVIDRVVQLINKTNQFNVTTYRHDRKTVEAFAADPSVYCTAFDLSDRYGPYGLIGVLIAIPDGSDYSIDTWLLSCRAMGRTVERGMFTHLAGWLKRHGATRLIGHFSPSKKNLPVKDLYPSLGFRPIDAVGHRFIWSVAPFPHGWNAYVRLSEHES